MKLQKNKARFLAGQFFSLIVCLTLFHSSVYATEFVYISDNLRVGVRTDPAGNDLPIGVVFTGMRLEVEDRSDGYIKIKTEKGLSGWIKDIYVTDKAPAIIQLNRLQAKYDKLNKELSQRSEASGALEKANTALNEQVDELKKERREWQRERAIELVSQYNNFSWLWIVLAILLLCGSFAGGAFWYRTQAMKRLGGLRV